MSNAKRPRTGARRVAPRQAPAPPPAPGAEGTGDAGARATHLGVRWQRQPSGLVRWWNVEDRRWVPYRKGDDAPPRPPGWERVGGPATDPTQRAGWRSPYRLIPPILIAVVIIGVIIAGESRGHSSAEERAAETKASAALVGKCLHQDGTSDGHPAYSSKAVACDAPTASVRVVRVLPGNPGVACPTGETGFSIPYPGVARPHLECVVPVARHG